MIMQRSITFALAAALAVAGCDALDQSGPEPSGAPVVARVAVSPESTVVQIGKTIQLNAAVTAEDGRTINDRPVDWFSYDASVAKVDAAGTVTGVGAGTATITASVDGKRGSSRVTVGGSTGGITITSVSPNPIVEGDIATIYGSNFGALAGNGAVYVDGVPANVTTASATSVQFTVPYTGCKPTRLVDVQVRLSGTTSNTVRAPLRPVGILNMPVGQQVLVRDPSRLCLQFGPSNSTEAYLIGVQSIAEQVKTVTPVTVTLAGAPSGSVVPAPAPLPELNLFRRADPIQLQESRLQRSLDKARAAEAQVRAIDEQLLRRYVASGARRTAQSYSVPAVPAGLRVGDEVTLRMPSLSNPCPAASQTTASVRLITNRSIWLEDAANPSGGYSLADLQQLANFFDNIAYDIDVSYLGPSTDIDQNGRIVFVVTKEVNKYAFARDPNLNLAGFVRPADLLAPSYCSSSNEGEIIYLRAPDPAGRIGAPTEALISDEVRLMRQLLPHEFTHVIQFAYMVFAGAAVQPNWMGEGQATLAEEITGHRITGHTLYMNYGFDVAWAKEELVSWYRGAQWPSYYYGFRGAASATRTAGAPEQCSWLGFEFEGNTGPCFANDNIVYGMGWSFLRWVSDQFGPAFPGGEKALHKALANNRAFGFAAVANTVGVPTDSLLAQWAAAHYVDDRIQGLNKRLTFTSWNLNDIEVGKNPMARLTPRERSFGTFTDNVSIRAGSTAYFRVSGNGRPSAAIRAVDPGGGALPSTMRMWVVRLQ